MFTRFTCQAAVCVCRKTIFMRKNRFVDNGDSEVSASIFPFSQPFRLYDKQSFSFCLMHSVLLKGTICKCIGRSTYITSCYARDVDYFLASCSEKFG